ncbi:ABC transporter ATP-binding protein [Paenibacillus sp. LHD-117]|uniref:ABC transporter ATP-binding protein n=1 Tax=Paenibacillus sp. LHD-117 TaxID=3071412 RepID=UPI0027DF6EE5|nr:ABC transporter ATP-binding protein [Paenibacillus sp. LHD-117]MDQ6418876.1 ABC transporter ATP-binding protein [Paenibacillus sp. LHD-117]
MSHIIDFAGRIYRFAGPVLWLNSAALLVIGILQSVGILLILPLLGITGLVDFDASGIPYVGWLFELFEGVPRTQSLTAILIAYVVISVCQSLFNRHQTILNKKIQQAFIRKLREETYKGLLKADWDFFIRHRKSDIVKLMTTEIAQVKNGLSSYFQFMSSLIFAAVKIVLAFLLSPWLTAAILTAGLLLLASSRYFTRKSEQFGQENLKLSKMYIAGITDHMNGIKDIKSNTLEQTHADWMSDVCGQAEHNAVAFTKLKTNSQFLYNIASAVLLAGSVYLLVNLFQSQPAQLLLVVLLFSRLWPVIVRIQSKLENLSSMIPSFEALVELQKDCEQSRELRNASFRDIRPAELKNGIELHGVWFRYNRQKEAYALKNVRARIPAKGMTAIVGPSGAGKTTLADVLMGLNRPERGEVRIDGQTLTEENLLSFRRSVSYVPQEPFLFNASIRENLLIMEMEATDDQLWEALELASVAEVVRRQPFGLDTQIGDKGIRLSGGEKQRLVLARAMLREPSILILDEATSALDTETERRVQETLERLRGQVTVIVIAHRLSTIRYADQVIVVDHGAIVQSGRYEELAGDPHGVLGRLLGHQQELAAQIGSA